MELGMLLELKRVCFGHQRQQRGGGISYSGRLCPRHPKVQVNALVRLLVVLSSSTSSSSLSLGRVESLG